MNQDTYEKALVNTQKAIDYFTTIYAKPHQEARIRNESTALAGLLAYKDYLEEKLGLKKPDPIDPALAQLIAPPKKGRPRGAKNKPKISTEEKV